MRYVWIALLASLGLTAAWSVLTTPADSRPGTVRTMDDGSGLPPAYPTPKPKVQD